MRTRAALLLCLAPALAGAQIVVTETSDDRSDGQVNLDECNHVVEDRLTFSWTVGGAVTSGTFTLYASDTEGCATGTSGVRTVLLDSVAATSTSGSSPKTFQLVSDVLTPLSFDCSLPQKTKVYFCVKTVDASSVAIVGATASGSLTYDTTRPTKPENVALTPGDGALNVSWSAGTGGTGTASSYKVTTTRCVPPVALPACTPDPADTRTSAEVALPPPPYRPSGLQNGETYKVTVVAYTDSGNPSANASDPAFGVPVLVDDFWRLYKFAGGREPGGCGSGAAGAPALLVLLALARRRRP